MPTAKPPQGQPVPIDLQFRGRFAVPGQNALDRVEWDKRAASITNGAGEVIFQQEDVEVPKSWSMLATNVVASKYFRRVGKDKTREVSVRQIITRVVDTLYEWGRKQGHLESEADATAFRSELGALLVNQMASFNSPVWFNLGVVTKPQCSACFINSVEDSMESILELAKTEGRLFKAGSGTGTNLSPIRSSQEGLSGGGVASGPLSFMRGWDAFAGAIKSGGTTRRAAKMVILNADHPDIEGFIRCKADEEKKAWALIEAGYDPSFEGEAYSSVFFQNSNNSVRVTDEFMQAVENDQEWSTRAVTTGQGVGTFRARELLRQMAEAAHLCGDPGIQFDTTINAWHTCAGTGRIHASNPCSEFMFLDDTACNLASINLMKFRRDDGQFDVDGFRAAVRVMILAQEIIVAEAGYPTHAITERSRAFRPLGLGYANLGALLMSLGIPYDSDEGRDYAAAVTALMTGEAYRTSARIARKLGPFAGYEANRSSMLAVIARHRQTAYKLRGAPTDLVKQGWESWDGAWQLGEQYGFRNSQVTVLAPTGTIGFMMDCDTTGVEPDIALVKYKTLVGGGRLKLVNHTVRQALEALGYLETDTEKILQWIEEKETIEGAPQLKPGHLPVFDCAFKPVNGSRSLSYRGHLAMMGAVQPFLSGAISKTVNLPETSTVEDIAKAYMEAWKLGLKALAIYRDGCKRSQPVSTRTDSVDSDTAAVFPSRPERKRMPADRDAKLHRFEIGGHEGYLTAGLYPDGSPGEVFLKTSKQGSTVSGFADAIGILISVALQYGVPLHTIVRKLTNMSFSPNGWTVNPQIRRAKSITDYLARWLALEFLQADEGLEAYIPPERPDEAALTLGDSLTDHAEASGTQPPIRTFESELDAPPCPDCGQLMVRSGACHKCLDCGTSLGCS